MMKRSLLLLIGLATLLAIFLRVYNLDERPPHHDESIHALYSFYGHYDPVNLAYKYDPMLHGPLMYKLVAQVYNVFGPSLEIGRLTTSLIHCLAIFIVSLALFRRWGLLAGSFYLLAISFSPMHIIWSRFFREDSLVLLFMSLMVFSAFYPIKRAFKIPLCLFFLILQFTVKENSYMTLGLLVFYFAFFILVKLFLKEKNGVLTFIRQYSKLRWTVLFVLLGLLSFTLLYSNSFTYMKGIWDGLYEKSLLYWFHQHKIERISGPFFYNFLVLTWYDLFFIVSALFFYFVPKLKALRVHLILLGISLLISIAVALGVNWVEPPVFIDQILKLKHPFDVFIFTFMLIMGAATTLDHLLRKEHLLAFLGFFFWANWFSYSYVGEKVPWLTLYPLFFGTIYHAILLSDLKLRSLIIKRKPLVFTCITILTGFQFFQIFRSALINEGARTELASQVHTTQEFNQELLSLRKKLLQNTAQEVKTKVLLSGEPVWPGTWYLFSLPGFYFKDEGGDYTEYKTIIADQKWMSWHPEIEKTHQVSHLPFRHWWQPNWKQISLISWANYLIFRKSWNEPATLNTYKLELIEN